MLVSLWGSPCGSPLLWLTWELIVEWQVLLSIGFDYLGKHLYEWNVSLPELPEVELFNLRVFSDLKDP